VVGEVIEVEDFVSLDRYEGVASGLYTREQVNAWLNDEEELVYIYVAGPALLQEIEGLPVISSGDWKNR